MLTEEGHVLTQLGGLDHHILDHAKDLRVEQFGPDLLAITSSDLGVRGVHLLPPYATLRPTYVGSVLRSAVRYRRYAKKLPPHSPQRMRFDRSWTCLG